MKSGSFESPDRFRGCGALFQLMAAVFVIVSFGTTQGWAEDLSAQTADSLSVNTPNNVLLPQSQAAEGSWLDGLHISGYASQTFGM
jgi:hypothetical protein